MRGKVSLSELARATGIPVRLLSQVRKGKGLPDPKVLASRLGVHVQTARKWARIGPPAKRLLELASIVADARAVVKAEREERKQIERLIREAKKAGHMRKAQTEGTSRFGGPRAAGRKTVRHLNEYLTPELLSRIEELVKEAPTGPNYIVSLNTVEAGATGKVRGYGGIITPKLGPQARNMVFDSVITSGRWPTKRKALEALFGKLRDAIEDTKALIMVADLVTFSYEYKDTRKARRLIEERNR